jgi:hypothetical protein
MFNWFLNFLEKHGRKEVMVDSYGDIHWHRYYLLYYEDGTNKWYNKLPNIYLHIFPTKNPDGEDKHSHPWSTLSLILKGGYREQTGDRERTNKVGHLVPLSYKTKHRIIEAIPGTVTLFAHWFKRRDWEFDVKKHRVICDYCRDNNNGVCQKKEAVYNFTDYLSRAEDSSDVPYAKRRSVKWVRVTPQLLKQIERRKEAMKKLGVEIPDTKEEKREFMKERILKRQK